MFQSTTRLTTADEHSGTFVSLSARPGTDRELSTFRHTITN